MSVGNLLADDEQGKGVFDQAWSAIERDTLSSYLAVIVGGPKLLEMSVGRIVETKIEDLKCSERLDERRDRESAMTYNSWHFFGLENMKKSSRFKASW